MSDDKLTYVPADDSGAGESVGTAPKTEKKLTKVKDVSVTFKSFSDLKLLIEVELIRICSASLNLSTIYVLHRLRLAVQGEYFRDPFCVVEVEPFLPSASARPFLSMVP